MQTPANTIECPECHKTINVNDILYTQVQNQHKKEFEKKLEEKEITFKVQQQAIASEKESLLKEKETLQSQIDTAVKSKLLEEKLKLEKSIRSSLLEENSEQLKTLQEELQQKSAQVKELNQTKAEIEKLKREKDELRDTVSLEKEREFSQKLDAEKQKIQTKVDEGSKELLQTKTLLEQAKREKEQLREAVTLEKEKELTERLQTEAIKIKQHVEEENALKMEELKKQLSDQKALADEMRRKAEQGSMQMQGEVQELFIEEWLRTQFPLDTIDEVKKGSNGADCIQIVHTHTQQNCGKICYESKNTKSFGGDWIAKLKEDTLRANANVAVLVTQVYPKGVERMTLIDGVWVCSMEEFKGLCAVLRQGIIQVSSAMATQENKGDKMVMLYDFLTGVEFRSQVEAIVDGFTEMQADLNTEKKALMKSWAKRQKQIDKVILNTVGMYGSIKGIAGNAVQAIQTLELPEGEDDAEE